MVNSGLTKRDLFQSLHEHHRDELRAVVEEAHKRGLKVTGHLCSIGYREAAEIALITSSMACSQIQNFCS